MGARLPSVVAGALTIPAAAAVGSAFSPVAGLVLAALVAVDPELVEQARTARMYPLLALLLLLAVGSTARMATGKDRRRFTWVGLGLVLGAAIWTHSLGVVVWLAVVAVVPFARGVRGRLGGRWPRRGARDSGSRISWCGLGARGHPAGIQAAVVRPVDDGCREISSGSSLRNAGWLLLPAWLAGLWLLAPQVTGTAFARHDRGF